MNFEFLTLKELKKIKFKKIGSNIKISKNVTIIGEKNISIGSNVRIDDYTIISAKEGSLKIGNNVHIGGQSYLGCAGGLMLGNEINISQGVKIYTKINDYLHFDGNHNKAQLSKVIIESKVIIGASSIIIGKCVISEGCSIGALSFVKKDLKKWSIYAGNPIKFLKSRKK
jgi:galactoside O-acetyltransferase|tara:strand:+ start:23 stop:532 length:510 start_codon:yes stop_codon:yes gene_type:complete